MATKIFDALDQLVATIQSAVPAGVRVYDGPQPVFPSEKQFVLVGVDDPLTSGMPLAVDAGTQDWVDLGAYAKDETFAILSTFVAWHGDATYAGLRAQAKACLSAIEAAVRPSRANGGSDGGLAGVLGPTGWCSLAVTRMQHVAESGKGAVLHVQFVIACTTRI